MAKRLMSTEYIRTMAAISEKQALVCSIMHWQELADLACKELGDRIRDYFTWQDCALCNRHNIGDYIDPVLDCKNCLLGGRDAEADRCCIEWQKLHKAVCSERSQKNDARIKEATCRMLIRLIDELDNMEFKEDTRRVFSKERG